LASLITAFQISLSCAFFHQADPSDMSEAVIQDFLAVYVLLQGWGCRLMSQFPTWRTRVSVLVWRIAFNPSGMGGPTGNICYHRHAPPLRQSRYTSGGYLYLALLKCEYYIFLRVFRVAI
jgi:hypothetical protein